MIHLPDDLPNSRIYDLLVVLKTQAIADELFEATVARRMRINNVDRDHAVEIIREEIGYWAG